jgi:hypothetical protein
MQRQQMIAVTIFIRLKEFNCDKTMAFKNKNADISIKMFS